MSDLYPTKTRLALLRDVADGCAWWSPALMSEPAESYTQRQYERRRTVTARMAEFQRAGWVKTGPAESASFYARRPWLLTHLGRQILDAADAP